VEPRVAHKVASVPKLSSTQDLADLLGVSPGYLTWLAWGLADDKRYFSFEIAKRSGEPRTIYAPIKPLKDIQRTLATALLDCYKPPPHVHGFTVGKSPKSNASIHAGKRYVLRIDLANFFPTISYQRVRGLFKAWPFRYPHGVACVLARLCCHNDFLPQGAPTSPIISNYICRRMDRELASLAAEERCHFSRYADDLCFSTSQHTFPSALAEVDQDTVNVGSWLYHVIVKNDFVVNHAKTKLVDSSQRQRVTGLVVNERVNVSREYVRSLRSLLYVWERYGKKSAIASYRRHAPPTNHPPDKPYPSFEQVIRGRLQHVGFVKGKRDPTYVKLADRFSRLDPRFHAPARPSIRAVLYTEGDSDHRHVLAAQRHFHANDEYLGVELSVTNEPSKGGDSKLKRFAERLAEESQSGFSVCLFDSDTARAREAVGSDGWRLYGPNVVAVGLVPPPWLKPSDDVFIEQLYSEENLKVPDKSARRLYLRGEFKVPSGHHESERCSIPGAGSREYLQTKVFEFDTGKELALSKVQFAKHVESDPEQFGSDLFDGFRGTFDRLELALGEAWSRANVA
jgi:RNA-directed DNA polymerase